MASGATHKVDSDFCCWAFEANEIHIHHRIGNAGAHLGDASRHGTAPPTTLLVWLDWRDAGHKRSVTFLGSGRSLSFRGRSHLLVRERCDLRPCCLRRPHGSQAAVVERTPAWGRPHSGAGAVLFLQCFSGGNTGFAGWNLCSAAGLLLHVGGQAMLVERGLQLMNVEVVGDAYAIAGPGAEPWRRRRRDRSGRAKTP